MMAVALLLALAHVAMVLVWRTPPLLFPYPWIVTTLDTVIIVISGAVSFLALGRYQVLRDPASYWTGIGFATCGVGVIFYLLAWPGLLPNGAPAIGHFHSTAAWVSLPVTTLLALFLLAAALSRWPSATSLPGRRWLWSLLAWLSLVVAGGLVTVLCEGWLPVLVEGSGAFTPLAVAWGMMVMLLFALGSALSARRYLATGDILAACGFFTQLVTGFALLMAAYGGNRFSLPLVVDRFIMIGGFLITEIVLLSEYVRLFRRERDRSSQLEGLVAERTRHLEEQRAELAQRNHELELSHRRLEEQGQEILRALDQVREKERMLVQQSRMAAMGEILVNIAHQWRQPLNVLGLIVQEMAMQYRLRQGEEDTAARRAMEVIRQMSRTIDDFRNFFRPDHAPVPFKVNEVLSKMVDMLGVSFREIRVPIQLVNSDEVITTGYPNQFSQAVLNILVNAMDAFLERPVPEPRVVVKLFREGERGVVVIADNAGGIPEDIIDRIFEPYFTTKGPDKGTGIGLYMAKALIANMNGSLTVRNANGGAEFRVEVLCEAGP